MRVEFPFTETSCCFYSSLFFVSNTILTFLYGYYVYSLLFSILIITSMVVHSHRTDLALLTDKIIIYIIVFYGGFLFYEKLAKAKEKYEYIYAFFIIGTFLATIFLYHYGYYCNDYCFNNDVSIAQKYHSFLHFISSIGHNLIVLM